MAHIIADRVADSSQTTGTGTITLNDTAFTGYQTISEVCSAGDTIFYCIAHRTLDQWEVGTGTYGANDTLARTTVLSSSNSGAAVNFSAGLKDVIGVVPASQLLTASSSSTLTGKTIDLTNNTLIGSVAEFNAALESADFYTTGGTDVAIADGGTGASTANAAIEALLNGGVTTDITLVDDEADRVFVRDASDSNLLKRVLQKNLGFTQAGTGGQLRSLQGKLRERLSVLDFIPEALHAGIQATSDTTDLAAYITTAMTAAASQDKALYFPSGLYHIGASLVIPARVRMFGDGPLHSVIKSSAGSNISAMVNADTADYWQIVDLQFDANMANNPSSGVGIFCSGSHHYLIERVRVKNCKTRGLDLTGPDTADEFGMEPTVKDVVIDTVGTHGVYYAGAHDGHFDNVIVIDASQTSNAGGAGFFIDTGGNGRWINCHAWSRSSTSNRMSYAFDVNTTGNQFIACHMEGAYTANLHLNADGNQFEGCMWYAAWNGVNILLRGSFNKISGFLEAPESGRPACKGIVFGSGAGDQVDYNYIDVVAIAQEAGILDFTNTDGNNTIYVRGYNASGTNIVGSPASTDSYDIHIGGGTTTILSNPTTSTDFAPVTNDGGSLGTSSKAFSDLYLASGGVVNFGAGDVTITHSSNILAFAGASSGYSFDGTVSAATLLIANGGRLGTTFSVNDDFSLSGWDVDGGAWVDFLTINAANTPTATMSGITASASFTPTSSDGAALGTTSLMWSDLFLASGGVINFDSGDITLTHAANLLTFEGGQLKILRSGVAGLMFDTASASQQCGFQLFDNGSAKWEFAKDTDHSFYLWDNVRAATAFRFFSNSYGVINTTGIRFPNISTTASAANAFLDSGTENNLLRSTSSIRYKHDVATVGEAVADSTLALQAISYRSLAEADDPDEIFYGYLAEDVAKVNPRLVFYDAQGRPDGVMYDRVAALQIAALVKKVRALEARLSAHSAIQ